MALLSPYLTQLAVRWVHVLGMATLFGGSLLLWGMLHRDADAGTPVDSLRAAATYERLFWAGVGLVVLTGVGNLGSFAPSIPGPTTTWGVAFATKLVGVLVLLVGSLVRTFGVVALLDRNPARVPPGAVDRLRRGYAATAVYLLAVVAMAEVLAHG